GPARPAVCADKGPERPHNFRDGRSPLCGLSSVDGERAFGCVVLGYLRRVLTAPGVRVAPSEVTQLIRRVHGATSYLRRLRQKPAVWRISMPACSSSAESTSSAARASCMITRPDRFRRL